MMRAAASSLSRNCGRGGGGSASPGARAPGARRRRAPYRWRATARRRARGPAGRPRERRRRRGETYRRGQRALVRLRGGRRSRNGARGKRKGGAPLSSSAVLERATAGGAPGSSAEATAAAARRSGGGRPDARTAPPLSLPPPRRRRAASGCTPSPRPGSPAAPGRRRRAHRRGADIESALAEARLFKTAIARWFARVLALPQARSTVRLSTPWTPARARCRVFFAWQVGPSLPALALNNPRCPRRRSPWADRRTRHTCAHPLDTSRAPQVANRGARAENCDISPSRQIWPLWGSPGSSPTTRLS